MTTHAVLRILGTHLAVAVCLAAPWLCGAAEAELRYCVVASPATATDPAWNNVVQALVAKHGGKILRYRRSVAESLDALRRDRPTHVCFVATPDEAGRSFVTSINRLIRQIDDDPYGDAIWGILTGYDAAGALQIAQQAAPLVIRRVAAGTEIELSACEEGKWYCELEPGKWVDKRRGQKPDIRRGPVDSTKALVDALNDYRAQLFVTSGHATERNWQIGYRYRNGQFRCEDGRLFGLDTQDRRHWVQSKNPKVYLAVGNCLMGHVDGPDAMALAFMNSAGVCQMAGYTRPTWYGYAGWGWLDYFVEQPGRFTAAEAFFANQQALIHRLVTHFPGLESAEFDSVAGKLRGELPPAARKAKLNWADARGLLYDRDAVAFYGDPAWHARMAPGPLAWSQSLSASSSRYSLEVRPQRGAHTFDALNTNGSQRGGRPIVQMLPHRISPDSVELIEGSDLCPVVTESFILVPSPDRSDEPRPFRVVFSARPLE